jgi:Ca-activated chloride channel homolog
MPATREVAAGWKFGFIILFFFCSLSGAMPAQTSVDDVHIVPRRTVPGLESTTESIQPITDTNLHVYRTDAKLVLVPVSVTDPDQRLVTGLSQDNFQVFEGKRPQTIRNFSSEDVPISVGIIVDSSGSMADKWDRVQEAVNQFCKAANAQDEFFMIIFNEAPRLATDFTSVPEDLQRELLFTHPRGRTSLLDAIHMGLRKMKDAKYGKKALLIISDGGDNHSRHTEREIKALAKESDVMIYSIGTFDRYVPTPEELQGPALLSEITEPTGGRAFTLDNVNSMPQVAHHIGIELRTQYVLGYRPQDVPHDGTWHKIRVKLRLPRKFAFLQAHAKSGYYARPE